MLEDDERREFDEEDARVDCEGGEERLRVEALRLLGRDLGHGEGVPEVGAWSLVKRSSQGILIAGDAWRGCSWQWSMIGCCDRVAARALPSRPTRSLHTSVPPAVVSAFGFCTYARPMTT